MRLPSLICGGSERRLGRLELCVKSAVRILGCGLQYLLFTLCVLARPAGAPRLSKFMWQPTTGRAA